MRSYVTKERKKTLFNEELVTRIYTWHAVAFTGGIGQATC